MAHQPHSGHAHEHGDACGHTKVRHEGHVDYIHDGHLHSKHDDHVDEHRLAGSDRDASCTGAHSCDAHAHGHRHGAGCGHEEVPHGDHRDYIVASHLHKVHGEHCDDHGSVALA
ncbi:MAG: hypothetical protein JO302_05030 [Candidatus Eremiobacteraeota bacterium]|nr:hypothetical protein [Candidatus Eremiobacteraeota bacterium]